MHARKSFYAWVVCFVFAFAAHVRTASAQLSGQLSDQMVIGPPGGTIFNNFIPEGAAGGESSLTFTPAGAPNPVPLPPGTLPGAITLPGAGIVVLTEPPTEPVDPTEPPLVTISGPNGPVTVSDIIW